MVQISHVNTDSIISISQVTTTPPQYLSVIMVINEAKFEHLRDENGANRMREEGMLI